MYSPASPFFMIKFNVTKTYCGGRKHYPTKIDQKEIYEFNPETRKLVKVTKGACSIC